MILLTEQHQKFENFPVYSRSLLWHYSESSCSFFMEIKRFKHMYSHLNLTKFLKELPKIPQKNPRFLESKMAVADVIASWVLGFWIFRD